MSARPSRLSLLAPALALLSALSASLLAGCGQEPAAPPVATGQRPDLVLIVVEALRADHITPCGYGRPTTPAFGSLAARGVVFDDNTAQSSATLPSMASMMTGRALLCDAQRVPAGVPTLAERLQAAGYQTVAFAGNPLVSRAAGFDRGFEVFLTRDDTGHKTWDMRDVYTIVTGWLAENPRDGRPRFFYIHFMDPHFPYWPEDRPSLPGENAHLSLEQRVRLPDDVLAGWAAVVGAAGPGSPLYDSFNAERWTVLEQIDLYDREIANVDAATGSILQALGTRGRVVVVAADHGEALWERPLADAQLERLPPEKRTLSHVFEHGHGGSLCQDLLRTPLIVSGSGFPVGRRVVAPTCNLDIVPTLLRAAGAPAEGTLDGLPLQDQLAPPTDPRASRPPIFSACRTAVAARDPGGYRLVIPTPEGAALGLPVQLYDLRVDPHERSNLATETLAEGTAQQAESLVKLRRVLENALAGFDLFEGQSLVCDRPEQQQLIAEFERGRE